LEQLFARKRFWNSFLRASAFWNSFYGVNSRFVDSPPSFSRGDIDMSIFGYLKKGI